MNIVEIEPILEQMVDIMESSKGPVFHNIDFTKREALEAMKSLLRRVRRAADKLKKKAMLPENSGKRWTEKADKCLEKMFDKEFDPDNEEVFYADASQKFGRTAWAIQCRLNHLKLLD